jgi:Prokaryotic cytochrome b561
VHGLLYAALLAQPVTGLLFMQAGDKTVSLAGLSWPMLVGSDAELHFQLKDLHVLTGQALYALIGLHVAAALWHHHVRRDDTLRRMLPWRRAAPTTPAPHPPPRPGALAAQAIDGARQQAAAHPPPARRDEHDEVTP